jgi:hypothetical protein
MKRRHAAAIAGALLLGLIAFPGGAAATTNEPIAQTGGMEATLPLLGGLNVVVTLSATGDISGVTLTPSGALSQTSAAAGLVTFSNADGSVTLKARAGGSKLTIGAHAKTLAALEGPGTWKADVFGTGSKSSVPYTVGHDGSGNPTLAIGTPSAAAGITATVDPPKTEKSKGHAVAAGGVTFAYGGFVKHLRIAVNVDLKDSTASIKITLSGRDRQRLQGTLAQIAGSRSWTGHLCDGTVVQVSYHLTGAGDLVFDGATGAAFTEKDWPGAKSAKDSKGAKGWHHGWFWGGKDKAARGTIVDGFIVRFDKTRVGFAAVLVKMADGSYALVAQGSSGKCGTSGKDGHHGSAKGGASASHRGDGDSRGSTAWGGGHRGSHGG